MDPETPPEDTVFWPIILENSVKTRKEVGENSFYWGFQYFKFFSVFNLPRTTFQLQITKHT